MNLVQFAFPEVSAVDAAFPCFRTNPELLAEAKRRGFYYRSTPYNRLFNQLFFTGGKVNFKVGLDEAFKEKAWAYCRALMGSFEPKHEEKEAVCALLMSELLEPKLAA